MIFAWLMALALTLLRPAEAQEYRRITLTDGRALVARVDATTADGLTLSLPQGTVRVPFSSVLNLEESDLGAWRGQPVWEVLVLPLEGPPELAPRVQAALKQSLASLPSTRVLDASKLSGRLDAGGLSLLAACGADVGCALPLAAKAGVTAVIGGRVGAGTPSQLDLQGSFVSPPARGEGHASLTRAPEEHPRELLTAAALSLLVMPSEATLAALPARLDGPTPAQAPAAVAEKPTTKAEKPAPAPRAPVEASRLRALAWVPLPGLPSMVRGDWGGVVGAWALAGGGSAALVYGAGSASTSKAQTIGLSALSVYTTTVASNLLFGLRDGGPGAPLSASLLPANGGATLALTLSR